MAGRNQEAFKRLEEVFEAGRGADEERAETLRLLIAVDAQAPRELVACIKEAFMPVRSGVLVDVRLAGDVAMDPNGSWDACAIIAGGSDEIVEHAAIGVGRHGNPVVIVAQSVLDIPESCLVEPISAFVDTIAASNAASLEAELSRWIMRTGSKSTAFAASFPFCRKARVNELARACAAQNAVIGVVNLLPGADMPYITVNQAKLALDIAAVYGEPFSFARLPELVGVVTAGFGYRMVSRILVGLIPGIGRILRGVTAYMGTLSTAEALSAHFSFAEGEVDDPVEAVREDLASKIDRFRGSLPAYRDAITRTVAAATGSFADDWSQEVDYDIVPEEVSVSDYIVYGGQGEDA